MKVGIVGAEAAKFDEWTQDSARGAIRWLLSNADAVVSGHSPLGGIDIWAVEEARLLGFGDDQILEFPPLEQNWERGFRPRNLQIAETSDVVACITVAQLPPEYRGRRFSGCYHCGTPAGHHVKSGGCWTMHRAREMGKPVKLVVVGERGIRVYPADLMRPHAQLRLPMEV